MHGYVATDMAQQDFFTSTTDVLTARIASYLLEFDYMTETWFD